MRPVGLIKRTLYSAYMGVRSANTYHKTTKNIRNNVGLPDALIAFRPPQPERP